MMKFLLVGILLAALLSASESKEVLSDLLTQDELNGLNDEENEQKRELGSQALEGSNEDADQNSDSSQEMEGSNENSEENNEDSLQTDGLTDNTVQAKRWYSCRHYTWGNKCVTRYSCSYAHFYKTCRYVVRTCRRYLCGRWIRRRSCILRHMYYWRPCFRYGRYRRCRYRWYPFYWRRYCPRYYQRYYCTRCSSYTRYLRHWHW